MNATKKLLVLLGLIIIVPLIYLGARSLGTNQPQQVEVARGQDPERAILQKQLEQREADSKMQDQKINELADKIESIQNKPPQVRIETKTVVVESKDTIADIVKEWSPKVAYVECTWSYTDTGNVYATASGSATIVNYRNAGIRAVTNKHVVLNNGNYPPACKIMLPGVTSYLITNDFNGKIAAYQEEDFALIALPNDPILNEITARGAKKCTTVNVGDRLIVTGYPGIGSQTGVTVTEGIVSADIGNYYVTSAKIDHGNSGGAAILIKDNCYLGIPSSSMVGTIESLGRILKAHFVYGN